MGTNVTYTWKIINNDQLYEFTGHQIPVQFFKAGTVEIEVVADNKIGNLAKKISFMVKLTSSVIRSSSKTFRWKIRWKLRSKS